MLWRRLLFYWKTWERLSGADCEDGINWKNDLGTDCDTTHSYLIKWSLGLCKFCRSTPLLRALGEQRIPAMRDHQSVNLLKRCLAASSAASRPTFYWSLIHNRDTDVKRTLVYKLNLVDDSISRVVFGNTRRLFYYHANDGHCLFFLLNMNNENFRILQNILYVDF